MTKIEQLKAALAALPVERWAAYSGVVYDGDLEDERRVADCDFGRQGDTELAFFIAQAHNLMPQLLEAVEALVFLREAYLNDDPRILEVIQGVLAGDVVSELLESLQ